MRNWEKLWENYSTGNMREEQSPAFSSPYIHGNAKATDDPKQNLDLLLKLINTGTNLADMESPKGSKEADEVLKEVMAVFDDMFEIWQKLYLALKLGDQHVSILNRGGK